MRPSIVVLCGDAGGANAVAPVIEMLRAEGKVDVHALAYKQAQKCWQDRSLQFESIPESTALDEASDLLRSRRSSLFLCGTSLNGVDLEKQFVLAARHEGIPSLAVLDFWSNYVPRFCDGNGELVFLPDRIAVMDEITRDEMISEGFNPKLLEVTGQPALEDLVKWQEAFSDSKHTEVRSRLGVGIDEILVLFASQPLTEMPASNPSSPDYRGYTEKTVINCLVPALSAIADRNNTKVALVIRPHPRETSDAYSHLAGTGLLRIQVVADGESRDVVMASDVVAGMNTMLLVESGLLGKTTISLQPGLRTMDKLPTNRMGLSIPVYGEEDVEPVLERALKGDIRQSMNGREYLSQVVGAGKRIADMVYRMIDLDAARTVCQRRPV